MGKKGKGWIKLHRSLADNPIWTSQDPFDRRSAWVDILLMVNHEERVIQLKNGNYMTIKPGQHFTSLDHLAEKWNWSRNRVRRFLDNISAQGMCTTTGTPSGTLLTVENWAFYQGAWQANGQADGQTDGQSDGQTDGQRTRSIKKYKNEKRDSRAGDPFWAEGGEPE